MKALIVAVCLVLVAIGCHRADPRKQLIQSIPTGAAATNVYQLLGTPKAWGHVTPGATSNHYELHISYMLKSGMGFLPTTNHTYGLMGYPHSGLCWIYDLKGETAFIQFTNYQVASVYFGTLGRMMTP
jgi:hypothetical protein